MFSKKLLKPKSDTIWRNKKVIHKVIHVKYSYFLKLYQVYLEIELISAKINNFQFKLPTLGSKS